jgi:hypothetical protein
MDERNRTWSPVTDGSGDGRRAGGRRDVPRLNVPPVAGTGSHPNAAQPLAAQVRAFSTAHQLDRPF